MIKLYILLKKKVDSMFSYIILYFFYRDRNEDKRKEQGKKNMRDVH